MDQHAGLPSITGKVDAQDVRPSTAAGGRRALGMLPKSAGAASVHRRIRHSEVSMTSSWQPRAIQTQRPSSTNVSSRGASAERTTVGMFATTGVEHASHQQQNGHSKELESDSRDEVQLLRNENDILRSKLVEKMRGQNKMVAGGQFRATSSSTVVKVPVAPSSGCTKCSTARMRSMKAHQESEQAQAETAELLKYVEKIEAAQERLWEERSAFVNEIARLRDELAEKVEECILMNVECTKLDKQVNMLQVKNDFAENLITANKRAISKLSEIADTINDKEVVDNATQCTLQQSSDEEVLQQSNDEKVNVAMTSLQEEVHILEQQLHEREQELKRISEELEEAQKLIKFEKEQREHETRLWREESSENKLRILELEQSEKKLRAYVQDLQRSHQKDVQVIEKANQQLHENIVAKEAEIQKLRQLKAESSAREHKQQLVVKELKVRNEQKVADVERLLKVAAVEQSSNAALRKQIERLEEQIETLKVANIELSASSLVQHQESVDHAQIESDMLLSEGQTEQPRLNEELTGQNETLTAAEKDNQALKSRILEVEAELAEQDELMQRQKRSHARAMERLLESSLRLCVVAPTVNVQLNTNGNLLNKASDASSERATDNKDSNELTSVICRSTPQLESIKKVIENDVLPIFTSVFLQGDDDVSPKADIPMNRWLQDLLHDMQARIATQLESIYSPVSEENSE